MTVYSSTDLLVNGNPYYSGTVNVQKCHPKLLVEKHTLPIYEPYPVYKKVPVYKYEKYPLEVPVKVPIYIKLKSSYGPASYNVGYGHGGYGGFDDQNKYDHEYHPHRGYSRYYDRSLGGRQYNSNNQYDDADYKKAKKA